MLSWYVPGRQLRSEGQFLAMVPRVKRCRAGGKSFHLLAAELWNSLPLQVRGMESLLCFRKAIKTLLFPPI